MITGCSELGVAWGSNGLFLLLPSSSLRLGPPLPALGRFLLALSSPPRGVLPSPTPGAEVCSVCRGAVLPLHALHFPSRFPERLSSHLLAISLPPSLSEVDINEGSGLLL